MQTKILNYGLNITPHKANYQAKVSSPDFAMPALRKDAFSKNVNFTALGTATMPIEFLQRGAITRELVHRLHLEEPEKLEILSNEARKLISGDKFVILPQYLDRTLDDMLNFTKTLKNNLDDKYGSGEYVVISIGRSPALTSEMLKAMGVETKICPMSGLAGTNLLLDTIKPDKKARYFEYFESIGLGLDTIKSSNKKYIFTDYCKNGGTLRSFQALLEEKGYDLPGKVIFSSLQDLAPSVGNDFFRKYFDSPLNASLSPVCKLYVWDMDKVQETVANHPVNPYHNAWMVLFLQKMLEIV